MSISRYLVLVFFVVVFIGIFFWEFCFYVRKLRSGVWRRGGVYGLEREEWVVVLLFLVVLCFLYDGF